MAGDPTEGKFLLNKYPLKNDVNLLGHLPQDNLKELLANADLYVFPTLSEGCASSVMEALAAGLPVITTRESGAPIIHAETGWIIPSKSADALAEAILILAEDTTLRKKIGQAACHMISQNYCWENYGRNVVRVYRDLLQAQ